MKHAFPIAPWARCLPLVGLLLAGCATFEPQAGRDSVRQSIQQKTGLALEPAGPGARAEADSALSADDAVRIALNNSPGVAALLAELDGAEAQAVQGSLLRNPFLHVGYLYPRDGHGKAIDAGLSWDLLGLISLGPRREAAEHARGAARLNAVAGILELAARSRAAWYAHLADREGVELLADQAEAADLNAEVARRLEQAGNLPPLAAAGAQASRLDARYALEDATLASRSSLEQLARLLGVGDPGRITLPERLPRLPAGDPDIPDPAALEAADLRLAGLRADLERARRQVDATERSAWTDGLELGWSWDREAEGEWKDGPSLGLALPLFDTGAARRAAVRAEAAQMEARIAERRLALAREAREAASRMQRARARVESLRESLLPLLSDAQDEALLQYNAMQKSAFDLLDLKQRELAAVRQLVQGLADYWRARTALEALKLGVSPGAEEAPRPLHVAQPASQTGGH